MLVLTRAEGERILVGDVWLWVHSVEHGTPRWNFTTTIRFQVGEQKATTAILDPHETHSIPTLEGAFIQVIQLRGRKVSIGIQADGYKIYREEML